MSAKQTNLTHAFIYWRTRLQGLLRSKGVTADSSEKYNDLVEKVKNIKQRTDVCHGLWTTTADADVFSWENLTFMPARLGMSSQTVLAKSVISSETKTYIGALSVDFDKLVESSPGIFTYNSVGTVGTNDLTSALVATVTSKEVNGVTLYDLSVSFAKYNETYTPHIYFAPGYEYEFVITSKEWFTT